MTLLKHATAAFLANAVTAAAHTRWWWSWHAGWARTPSAGSSSRSTLGGLIAVLPNFGLDRIVQRQVIRERERLVEWVASAAVLRLLLAGAAIGVA